MGKQRPVEAQVAGREMRKRLRQPDASYGTLWELNGCGWNFVGGIFNIYYV